MVRITAVEERSRAQRHGIAPGDYLCSINGHEIRDVLDYRFYLASVRIHLCLRHPAEGGSAGEAYEVLIAKREYDDIGLDFETPLMDKKAVHGPLPALPESLHFLFYRPVTQGNAKIPVLQG